MKRRCALVAQPDGLAHYIAPVRKDLGLSQEAFAETMGVSRNTVVTYEHGQTPCTAVLDRIARAGGVTAE
jgi:transcriptional regulator with XRE-family HTH domain